MRKQTFYNPAEGVRRSSHSRVQNRKCLRFSLSPDVFSLRRMGTVVLMCPDVNRRRMDGGRTRPDTTLMPPRHICRRLFQETDSSQSRISTLKELEREEARNSSSRWNFDFRAGVPLPGRFKWVPVHLESDPKPALTEESPPSVSHPTKQSKITDFMKKRKLMTDSTTDLSSKTRRKLDCGLT